MTVMLYDYKNNTFVKENRQIKKVQTDSNGEYTFNNLDKGQYIVVFLYDSNIYTLTEYQKDGVIDSKNSDVVTKTIGIEGEKVTAGLTNTLTAESNLKNIDIGLVENKKFDFEIQKYISKITVQTKDGKTKTYTYDNKQFAKVEINRKQIDGATVVIEYKMIITNKGEVPGKAVLITDKLPEGLKFKSELNSDWYESNGSLYTNSLSQQTINVGENKEVSLILTKEVNSNNVGTITNIASIGISNNDRAIEDENKDNDSSSAQVIIGVSTGLAKWLGITISTIIVLTGLAFLIWKNRKILKTITLVLVFAVCLIGNTQHVFGLGIKGVNTEGANAGTQAIGTDGKTYWCANHGKYFCESVYHPATYSSSNSSSTVSYSGWSAAADNRTLTLTNKTNSSNVTYSKIDNNYNKVGPYRVDSTINEAKYTVTVSYKDKDGNSKSVTFENGSTKSGNIELMNFGWGKDFYIKVPNTVVQLTKITVTGKYAFERTRTKTTKQTLYYTTEATASCPSSISQKTGNTIGCRYNGIQDMSRTETKTETEKQSTDQSKTIDINGPWTLTGDLKIDKFDAEDEGIKLKNAEFKIRKGTASNAYMSITKNGSRVSSISANTIEIIKNTTNAKINGQTGYTIQFKATENSATKILTDATGIILIKNLECGAYTIIESGNKNYGYTKVVTTEVSDLAQLQETTLKIENEKQVGDLTITKVDQKDSSVKLEGVKYRLKATDESGSTKYVRVKGTGDNITKDSNGWAKTVIGTIKIDDTDNKDSNPTFGYTTNKDEATIFITDENGEISIQNLVTNYNGKSITYHLEEIENPNYGYNKTNNPSLGTIKTGEKNTKTVQNEKQVGEIYIKKVDYANRNTALQGVEYYLKSSQGYVKIKVNGEWAKRVEGTVKVEDSKDKKNEIGIGYTNNKDDATIFVTDSKGEIYVQNLLISNNGTDKITYEFEEIINPNYGYTKIENIKIKEIKPYEKVTLTVTNEKQVGNIYIKKVDEDDNSIALGGVKYYLNSSQGYVKIKINGQWAKSVTGTVKVPDTKDRINDPTLEYTSNKDEATIFITDSKGEIYVQNLLISNDGTDRIKYDFEEIDNLNYGYTKLENISIKQDIKPYEKVQLKVTNQKQVGEIYIKKIDDRVENKVLSGVEFVLKSSYQDGYIKIKGTGDNVENGWDGWTKRAVGTVRVNDTTDKINKPTLTYTKNKDDATKFVTDSNAEIYIKNLLTSSDGEDIITYKLEEVGNQNYGYLIESKKHPNVFESTQEGVVTSDGTVTPIRNQKVNITVKNHQEYIRIEGYVWEEISKSKSNEIDNLYQETDALIKGINVYLCKNGQVVATQVTDENGWYQFGTVRPQGESYQNSDYLTPQNGNLEIDELANYYVDFEYDGLRFTSVEAIVEYLNEKYDITSKATEVPNGRSDRKDRQSVNNDFSVITGIDGQSPNSDGTKTYGQSKNSNGAKTYDLIYSYNNHESTYIDYWGYEYNEDNTRLTVTPAKGYYEIIASTKTSGFNLKDAWEARCEKTGEEVLDGINLGIERRAQADLAISSDLNEVNIAINTGTDIYENTYTYAKRNIDGDANSFEIETKFGTDSGSYSSRGLNLYTRRIYESDLAYIDNKTNPQLMKIYVTYKIRVKNQSTTETLAAKVNELVNYYDSRYEISDSWLENGTKVNVNWTGNKNIGEGYTAVYTNSIANTKISAGGYIDIYIKFRLNDTAVSDLIKRQTTLNNVSEISAFSTITVKDDKPYAAIDEDSNPGSAQITLKADAGTTSATLHGQTYEIENKTLDTTTYEDDTDMAPSLVLGIEDNTTRGLSGTVFEDEDLLHDDDNTHPGEERLGNGQKENSENGIYNAKVELLNETGTEVVNLYQLTLEDGRLKGTEVKAETYTDENGEYQFLGIVPGRYLIRYTYDDDTYIVDASGNKIKIDPRDYKSTIITSNLIKTALNLNKEIVPTKEERMGDLNWILPYEGKRYSDAVDDITKRENTDNVYYGNLESTNLVMTADTAYFDVGVEYSDVESDKQTSEGFNGRVSFTDYKDEYDLPDDQVLALTEAGRIVLSPTFYAVNPYQDFGIIERPRQVFDVNKRVSNLKVTLANGQILINGNPYKTAVGDEYDNWEDIGKSADPALQYVKALPGSVNAEIDNEIIQAATLNIEYTISIKNDSEIDYTEEKYYYYGTGGHNKLTSTIKKVVDYMEDDLVYDEKQNEETNGGAWMKVLPDKLLAWEEADGTTKQLIANGETVDGVTYNVYDSIKQGYTVAVTEIFANGIEPGTAANVQIYGSKVLGVDEDGVAVSNHAEIIETARHLKNPDPTQPYPTPGNYDPATSSPNEPDDGKTSVIITPPTGLIDNTPFVIIMLSIILVVLSGGIYLIKKKAL